MPSDMCTKPCSGPIISQSKWMTGLRFYPNSDTEHYQFMRLHEFIVKKMEYQENILHNSHINLNKVGASSMEQKCH